MHRLIILFFSLFTLVVAGAEEKPVKFLTYNVLADPVHKKLRVPVLMNILERSDADIIALQEVDTWFIELLQKEKWFKKYQHVQHDEKTIALGGLMILSKQAISKIHTGYLPSRQGRRYLMVETKVRELPFTVATCHLDSPLELGKARAEQLEFYFQTMAKAENAVFLGDFNFGDKEEPETSKLKKDYVDSWLYTNPKDVGYTWDIEKSVMAKAGSFKNEKSRRLDRVLVKSKSLMPIKTEIVGSKAIEANKDIFPSDHFGVLSTLQQN